MDPIRKLTGLIAISACIAFTQGVPPAFEVASVKPAGPSPAGRTAAFVRNLPGRIEYPSVTLKTVLARAYGMKATQINGPAWIDSEHYEIIAKLPAGAAEEQIPAMLQTLLAERFQLAVHKETKEETVYALVVGKNGPKLKRSDEGPAGDAAAPGPEGAKPVRPRGATLAMSAGKIEFTETTIDAFARTLAHLLHRPVVDMTQIEGKYDIVLEFPPDELPGMPRIGGAVPPVAVAGADGQGGGGPVPERAPAASIFTAIQQLGLKLESRKAPVERLIVDRAERVPSEN
jgi:uncharacterized protein (TIGR03435 family)